MVLSSFVQLYKNIYESANLETGFGTRNSRTFLCVCQSTLAKLVANHSNYVCIH